MSNEHESEREYENKKENQKMIIIEDNYEHELGAAMKLGGDAITLPAQMDLVVVGKARQALEVRKRKTTGTGRWAKPIGRRFVLTALIVLILCGFSYGAAKLLDLEIGHVRVEVMSDRAIELTQMKSSELRTMVEEVRMQLLPGETAVMYVEPLTRERHSLLREFPGLGVSRDIAYTDWAQWSSSVQAETEAITLSDELIGKYTFNSGVRGYQFGAGIGLQGKEALDQLREDAERTGARMSWTKVAAWDYPILPLTSFYQSNSGEEIYLTLELFGSDAVGLKQYSNQTEFEQLRIGETDVIYSDIKHFLSDTEMIQEVFWLVDDGRQVVNVHIGTESRSITKDELLAIAADLMK